MLFPKCMTCQLGRYHYIVVWDKLQSVSGSQGTRQVAENVFDLFVLYLGLL
jgi:hypothetical protein